MTDFYMMIGLSGSGKTHFGRAIAKNNNAVYVSSDLFRKEKYGDESIQGDNEELFDSVYRIILQHLANEKSVVFDATNLNYKRRMSFLQRIKSVKCSKIAIWVATPVQACLKNNESRERKIPEYVIDRQFKSFTIPQYFEGWDNIEIIWNIRDELNYDAEVIFEYLDKMEQDNSHHVLTVGQHCQKVFDILRDGEYTNSYQEMIVCAAGILHDVGKMYTKTFRDSRGNPSEEAHYYNHEACSAYVSAFLLRYSGYSDHEILDISGLIQYHMRPYGMVTEKSKNKFLNLVGQEFYDNLMILNDADKRAK